MIASTKVIALLVEDSASLHHELRQRLADFDIAIISATEGRKGGGQEKGRTGVRMSCARSARADVN